MINLNDCFATLLFVLVKKKMTVTIWNYYFGGFGNENIQHDFRRAMVVLGCFGVFLGIWWVLILTRKPRPSRTDRQP